MENLVYCENICWICRMNKVNINRINNYNISFITVVNPDSVRNRAY